MVTWLKVGITTWHHKGRKWGVEAVGETTPPHIPASNSTPLWSENAASISKRGKSSLPAFPVPRCSQTSKNVICWNYVPLSISIVQYEEEVDEKLQKYVHFKPRRATNPEPVEGFRKMLNVKLCVNCSELHWSNKLECVVTRYCGHTGYICE